MSQLKTVLLRGLGHKCLRDHIYGSLSDFGHIMSVRDATKHSCEKSRAFYITFDDNDSALAAADELNGAVLHGKRVSAILLDHKPYFVSKSNK